MVVPHPEIDTYALLTRPPLPVARPCDLHVLSMPPAFALSQDQTLRFIMSPVTEEQNEQTLSLLLRLRSVSGVEHQKPKSQA